MKQKYTITLDSDQVDLVPGKLSTLLNELLIKYNKSKDSAPVKLIKQRIGQLNREISVIKSNYHNVYILEQQVKDLTKTKIYKSK